MSLTQAFFNPLYIQMVNSRSGRHIYTLVQAQSRNEFTWLFFRSLERIPSVNSVLSHQEMFHPGRGNYCIYYCDTESQFLIITDPHYFNITTHMGSSQILKNDMTNGIGRVRLNENQNSKLIDLAQNLNAPLHAFDLNWFKRAFGICYRSCYDYFSNGNIINN